MVENLRPLEKAGVEQSQTEHDPWADFRNAHPKLYGCGAGAVVFGVGTAYLTKNPIAAVVAGVGGCAFGAWEESGLPFSLTETEK